MLNDKERQIIQYGIDSGKSRIDIMRAVSKYRISAKPKGGIGATLKDIPSDIGESFRGAVKSVTGGMETARDISGRVVAGETTPLAGTYQTIGAGLKAGAGVVGEVVLGLGKSLLSPKREAQIKEKVETGAKAIAETEPVQMLIEKYQSLTPEQQRNIDATLGIAEGLTTMFGVSPAIKAFKKSAKIGKEAVESSVELAKKSIEPVIGKITPEASSIMQRVARVSKGKQAKFETMAGESIGEYLDKRSIYGNINNISKKLYERFNISKNTADEALASLQGNYKPRQVGTALDDLFTRESRISSPGALSKDIKRVRDLKNKYNKEGLDMSEINEVKRLYERNIKLDFIKQNLPESVAKANTLDDSIRQWQFAQAEKLGLKNLPEINRETRLAKQLLDDIGQEYSGAAGNNAITLSDWIILAGGDPTAISTFLIKKGISSKTIQSEIAKIISKSEKIGLPKAEFGQPKPGLEEFLRR